MRKGNTLIKNRKTRKFKINKNGDELKEFRKYEV